MKILLAPDKFRGALSAEAVCVAMRSGILAAIPDATIESIPLSDGGEGFTTAVLAALGGEVINVPTTDPLGRSITAKIGFSGNTAYFEMADASGLVWLQSNEYNPLKTSTLGTEILLDFAIKNGAKRILIGLGGSATNDAGLGMALGWQFLDVNGKQVYPSGENLLSIVKIIPPEVTQDVEIIAATDVENPLYGPNGAATVFSPQKGASPETVQVLDDGLRHLSEILSLHNIPNNPEAKGAGAAGGLGFGLVTFMGAKIVSGIELLLDLHGLDTHLPNTNWILTGEGRLDEQTTHGKLIAGLCRRAKNVPVAALCGQLAASPEALRTMGLSYAASVSNGPGSLADALANAPTRIHEAAFWWAMMLIQKKN